MNPNDLPQSNMPDQNEIFRLLKIGDFAVQADNASFVVTKSAEPESIKSKLMPKLAEAKALVYKGGDYLGPVKGLVVYLLVFLISFLVFYFTMNFPSLVAQAQGLFAKSQNQEVLGEDLAAYNQWIRGYFYSVSDKDLLTTTNDYDKDGLTNYDEFILRTNPTLADSDSDGTTDGVEVLNSSNPWGAGSITTAQDKLRSKINLNMVSERISYGVSANKDKPQSTVDTDNFDLTRPGVLSIPKLKIQVPLIFSNDPASFDADLQKGVIHYPGTALPGSIGTMYVSGHSSDYIWKKDKFATIFTKINYLTEGDDVFVTVYGKDGKVYNYRYRVTTQKVFAPDDQTQFIDNSQAKLNLSTCWPIGTAKDRMVVTAVLVNL